MPRPAPVTTATPAIAVAYPPAGAAAVNVPITAVSPRCVVAVTSPSTRVSPDSS
jgi:hypothetical protein